MRIVCLISSLGAGGAEKVMALLANHLASRHDVWLLTLEPPGTQPFHAVDPRVSVCQLGLATLAGQGRLRAVWARFAAIRSKIAGLRPDVVLSFMDTMNMMAIGAGITTGIPVVVSERVDPAQHRIGMAKSLARRMLYPFARTCVVQTTRIRDFSCRSWVPRPVVIPNPVPAVVQTANPSQASADGCHRIVALGRLHRQKGFDILIEAFRRVAKDRPDWSLTIYGEGEERTALQAQIDAAGLADRIALPGLTTEAAAALSGAHILAFPSRYEGFPNALAEGMAAGLPAIGFRNVSGVEDLIVDGETGLLADDADPVAALAAALARLMSDAGERGRMGTAAKVRVKAWDVKHVLGQWEAVLNVAAGHMPGPEVIRS